VADRIKSFREVERYYDNIWIGLKQVGDGVEKEDDGSRRRTSGAKGELIRKVETGRRCKEGWVKVCLLQFAPSSV